MTFFLNNMEIKYHFTKYLKASSGICFYQQFFFKYLTNRLAFRFRMALFGYIEI